MINNTVLVGRLTKDPDIRYTQSGVAVVSFTLAVDRRFKNQQGERETDFIMCVAWRKTAEIIGQYCHKGSQIGVEGSIQTRNYENQQGQRIYVTEVNVENITLLDSKKDTQGQQDGFNQGQGNFNQSQAQNQGGNFNANQGQNNPFTGAQAQQVDMFAGTTQNQAPDITDDDLPF